MGRLCADLYPEQLETPLSEVETSAASSAASPGTWRPGSHGSASRCTIVSAVGDDGHGEYVRRYLEREGVDCSQLGTHPTLRTALAFCEAWPPDRFPITFYRTPTCPDWELRFGDLDLTALRRAAARARDRHGPRARAEPHRDARPAACARGRAATRTIFDADWRAQLWDGAGGVPRRRGPRRRRGRHRRRAATASSRPRASGRASAEIVVDQARARRRDGAPATAPRRGSRRCPSRSSTASAPATPSSPRSPRRCSTASIPWRPPAAAAAPARSSPTRLACSDAMPTRAELEQFLGAHA